MKNLLFLFLFAFVGVMVFAQDGQTLPVQGVVTMQAAQDGQTAPLQDIFATFLTLVAFIPVVVQFLRNVLFKGASGLVMQIISWVIGLLIAIFGWWIDAGFLADLSIGETLIYGAGACLAANGVFDTGIVSAIIDSIFGLFKKK